MTDAPAKTTVKNLLLASSFSWWSGTRAERSVRYQLLTAHTSSTCYVLKTQTKSTIFDSKDSRGMRAVIGVEFHQDYQYLASSSYLTHTIPWYNSPRWPSLSRPFWSTCTRGSIVEFILLTRFALQEKWWSTPRYMYVRTRFFSVEHLGTLKSNGLKSWFHRRSISGLKYTTCTALQWQLNIGEATTAAILDRPGTL